ncbi:Sel1 repeat protein [Dictyocaulus viviparus]|uniref:Sel1 repeat protein n=1 Tax=Dictyocaulus viviparus TaxID=29172 RepID=A0A0D8XG25_DICVI|nr:Sel1 repeat protein [Dictyocaulus viviparus]
MSSQRLALSHIIRHGQRFVSFPHPASSNDKRESPASNIPRFSDIVLPLLGSNYNGLSSIQFTPLLGSYHWTPSLVFSENGSGSTYTIKVGVQTDDCEIYPVTKVDPIIRKEKAKWDLENLIGEELLKAGKTSSAITRFQAAASHGNANAMNNLAECFFSGLGITCNKEMAFSLWEQSASLGNANAMYALAVCLIRAATAGEPKGDKTRAIQLMKKAALKGNVHAAFYLVVRHIRDSDLEEAESVIRIAACDEGYASEMESWTEGNFLDVMCSQFIKQALMDSNF